MGKSDATTTAMVSPPSERAPHARCTHKTLLSQAKATDMTDWRLAASHKPIRRDAKSTALAHFSADGDGGTGELVRAALAAGEMENRRADRAATAERTLQTAAAAW